MENKVGVVLDLVAELDVTMNSMSVESQRAISEQQFRVWRKGMTELRFVISYKKPSLVRQNSSVLLSSALTFDSRWCF